MKNKLRLFYCLFLSLNLGHGTENPLQQEETRESSSSQPSSPMIEQDEASKGCESGASTPLMEKDNALPGSDSGSFSLAQQRRVLVVDATQSAIPTKNQEQKLDYKDAYGRPHSVPIMESLATFPLPDKSNKNEGLGFAFRRPTFPPSTEFVQELIAVADQRYLDGPHAAVAARLFMPVLDGEATKKAPVIICACDSFGFRKDDRDLALRFMEAGFASIWIDSETSNNNKKVAYNQMGASLIGNVAEMYYAFKLAKTHPHLDPNKVLAYGSSRGGVIVELCRRHDLSLHFGRGCSFKGFHIVSGLPIIQPNDWALSRTLISAPAYYYHGIQDNWNSRQAQYNWYKRQAEKVLDVSWREYLGGHGFERNVEPRHMKNVMTLNSYVVVMHAELMDFQNLPARIMALEKLHKGKEKETDAGQPQRSASDEILAQILGYVIIGEQPYPGDEAALVRSWLNFFQDFTSLSRGADVKPDAKSRGADVNPNAISKKRFIQTLMSDMRTTLE